MCCALAACNESYPGLYAPVYDADNPNPEMTADSIPVTLSLTDPAYALVTGKRGQGSFGFWDDEEERAKWMAAEFGVYAFPPPGLLPSQPMKLPLGAVRPFAW